jgi:hypothetical protein
MNSKQLLPVMRKLDDNKGVTKSRKSKKERKYKGKIKTTQRLTMMKTTLRNVSSSGLFVAYRSEIYI